MTKLQRKHTLIAVCTWALFVIVNVVGVVLNTDSVPSIAVLFGFIVGVLATINVVVAYQQDSRERETRPHA